MTGRKASVLVLFASALSCMVVPTICVAQDKVHGDIGAGIADVPYYLGSDQSHLHVVPVLSVGLTTPHFYLGNRYGGLPLQAGMTPLHTEHWVAGLDVSYQTIEPRSNDSSANDYPEGLSGIARTALIGAFLQYHHGGFSASLRSQSDILGHGQGRTLSLDARETIPLNDRLSLGIGPQWVWGNSQHMNTFFGIDTAESAATGLHVYTPGSGSQEIELLANMRYLLTPTWVLGGGLSVGRLSGVAADSPIVIDRMQRRWTFFMAYRF